MTACAAEASVGAGAGLRRGVDIFLASYQRPERLTAMLESVRATGYPARVLVAAGDTGTIETCRAFEGLACPVYSAEANRRVGCTAPLNLVFRELVRRDALFCTDDCLFAPDALDVAMATLDARFPDGDGVVGLMQENIPDGYPLAFPLMGRAFLDRFRRLTGGRELFFPGYYHLFNDAEMGMTLTCLGNWVFERRARLRHFHPSGGGAEDATFVRGFTHKDEDRRLWCQRRLEGRVWGMDAEDGVL